jgi:hypothetical protein
LCAIKKTKSKESLLAEEKRARKPDPEERAIWATAHAPELITAAKSRDRPHIAHNIQEEYYMK